MTLHGCYEQLHQLTTELDSITSQFRTLQDVARKADAGDTTGLTDATMYLQLHEGEPIQLPLCGSDAILDMLDAGLTRYRTMITQRWDEIAAVATQAVALMKAAEEQAAAAVAAAGASPAA